MYYLKKTFRFEAAHHLPKHLGKCSRVHGHSFVGTLFLASEELFTLGSSTGMVLDFAECSKALAPLLEHCLDHYDLNVTTGLEDPTSENLCKWIYGSLIGLLPDLIGVALAETCTCEAMYFPEPKRALIPMLL